MNLLENLNMAQREAVLHTEGPAIIIAGAGTGKTTAITKRIAHLIASGAAKPGEILALTFTEKAAAEMAERLDGLMEGSYENVAIETFHAFADGLLRERGIDIGIDPSFSLLTQAEEWIFFKKHLYEYQLEYYRPAGTPTKFITEMLTFFERLRDENISPSQFTEFVSTMSDPRGLLVQKTDESLNIQNQQLSDPWGLELQRYEELAHAYTLHTKLKREANLLSFGDLLYYAVQLIVERPNVLAELQKRYRYFMVDEFQDTNIVQNELVEILASETRNIMVVGDDDQSIYKFRGAAISNILQFQKHFPESKKIVLTENYRSNQAILDAAYFAIQQNNPHRLEIAAQIHKRLIAARPTEQNESEPSVQIWQFATETAESVAVATEIEKRVESGQDPSEIAVLVRANAHAKMLIAELDARGIPSHCFGTESALRNPEVKHLLAFLRVIAEPFIDIPWQRLLGHRFFGITASESLELFHKAKSETTPLFLVMKGSENERILACKAKIEEYLEMARDRSCGEVLWKFLAETETFSHLEKEQKVDDLEAITALLQMIQGFEAVRASPRGADETGVSDFLEYLDAVSEAGGDPRTTVDLHTGSAVSVMTIHASKGLEWRTVFVLSNAKNRFPGTNRQPSIPIPDALVGEIPEGMDDHIAEERRLFYVALTRAKERVILSSSTLYGSGKRKSTVSPFLAEMGSQVSVFDRTSENPLLSATSEEEASPQPFATLAAPIERLSYSQLSEFQSCPKRYAYNYLLKVPTPPKAAFSFGTTLHGTLYEFYKLVSQKQQSATLFSEHEPDTSLEKLLGIYENKWIGVGYESRGHMNKRKEDGRELLIRFFEKHQEGFGNPLKLEESFALRIGKYTLSGRFDRIDRLENGSVEIFDYKTGRTKEQKEVDKDLQLSIYALAAKEVFGLSVEKLSLYFLESGEKVETIRSEADLDSARAEIEQVADSINESAFHATPDRMKCSYCPYREICDESMA